MRSPVRPAFALALYGRFLTPLSRPLGAPDAFSGAYRPSQAAHQPLFPGWVSRVSEDGQCYMGASTAPREAASKAPAYTMHPRRHGNGRLPQSSTGSTLPSGGPRPMHREGRFAGYLPGTAGKSLSHSCRPAFNRQGITLPLPRSRSSDNPSSSCRMTDFIKTVRVTAAVYRGLAGLKPGFTHRHWAGLTGRTHRFRLATGYVFVKQSLPPCHCNPRFHSSWSAGTPSTEDTGPICRVP